LTVYRKQVVYVLTVERLVINTKDSYKCSNSSNAIGMSVEGLSKLWKENERIDKPVRRRLKTRVSGGGERKWNIATASSTYSNSAVDLPLGNFAYPGTHMEKAVNRCLLANGEFCHVVCAE
jgi:hypothetical protein